MTGNVASRVQQIEEEREERDHCADWKLEPTRFSSWTCLVRLQVNMRSTKKRIKWQELLLEEIEDAEEEILSRAELEVFPEEYLTLLTERRGH